MKAWPTRLAIAVPPSALDDVGDGARGAQVVEDRLAGMLGQHRLGDSAVMKSPGTNSPVSSMKKQRSASPSQAMPRSAPVRLTSPMMNWRFSSSSGFGW